MQNSEFSELEKILKRRKRARPLYWGAAVIFFFGFFWASKNNMESLLADASIFPFLTMLFSAGLYAFTRLFIK
jgi:hypothetical protein